MAIRGRGNKGTGNKGTGVVKLSSGLSFPPLVDVAVALAAAQ